MENLNLLWSIAVDLWGKIPSPSQPQVAMVSAAAASLGALATWKAAKEAARSAGIAEKSMNSASDMAMKNFMEMARFNRRSAFENRYGLLLAQHNLYHNQLCDYIDKQKTGTSSPGPTAIGKFFEHDYHSGSMGPSLSFLTGHQIISRYMRTLYHLLKFIKNEFYIDKGDNIFIAREMKNYVSPVRSTIRNDILCLIAVNALNIENKNAESTGYVTYQNLLHFFDFFEHAVFHSPFSPNKVFEDENVPARIHDLILKQSDYDLWFATKKDTLTSFELRGIKIFSPVIACLIIYKNPMKSATIDAIANVYNKISNELQMNLSSMLNDFHDNTDTINDYKNGEYVITDSQGRIKTTQKLIDQITSSLQNGDPSQYFFYNFYAKENLSTIRNTKSGHDLMVLLKYIIRHEAIVDGINRSGGLESFLANKKRLHEEKLPLFYKQINIYSSLSTNE